jgi:hypothetical protein
MRSCHQHGGTRAAIAECLERMGWLILVPMLFSALAFLFVAALYNTGWYLKSAGDRVAAYAYSVHIISSMQEVFLAFVMYFMTGRYCMTFYCCCFPVMTFGKYYQEKVKCGLVEDKDYVKVPKQSYFCGLIGVERIIEKDLWEGTSAEPSVGLEKRKGNKPMPSTGYTLCNIAEVEPTQTMEIEVVMVERASTV